MVKLDITDPNTGIRYQYYMDNELDSQIEKKIIPALKQKDEDWVVCVDGGERKGKSVFAMQLARRVDHTFTIQRMCLSVDEFKRAIINAKKGQCVIFDEAYRGYSAKGTLSEMNRVLESMMMEMGQKNLFVIVVLPTFFLMSKYAALWRARGLFHITKKSYWRYYNAKKKLQLYLKGKKDLIYPLRSRFKGRFYEFYTINEQEYRKKKAESFQKGFQTTKDQNYLAQRNRMIHMLYNDLNYNQVEIAEMFQRNNIPLKRAAIGAVLNQFKKNNPGLA